MILLTKIRTDQDTPTVEGIPINNLVGSNEAPDGKVWVRYWDGAEVRKMVVQESMDLIARKMNFARTGIVSQGE
jgi:hypothetical protein